LTTSKPSKPRAPRRYRFTPVARDVQILYAIALLGCATAEQIEQLYYTPGFSKKLNKKVTSSSCQGRLRDLLREGYLRLIERYQLLREGKKPYIYALTDAGASFLARQLGCEVVDLPWRRTDTRLRADYIEHLLLTNSFRTVVLRGVTDTPPLVLRTWHDDLTLKSTHASDKMRITGPTGKQQTAVLVPDGYFVLGNTSLYTGGDDEKAFMVEIDRATEPVFSNDEQRASWVRKIRMYLEYFKANGFYQQRYGTHKGRVLTITTSEQRMNNLIKMTEQAGGMQRFWFTTFDLVTPKTVLFTPIWRMANFNKMGALLGREGEYK
jgi:hypothetical protein